MKKLFNLTNLLLISISVGLTAFALKKQDSPPYFIDHENDIKKEEPGSHNGGGTTTAYPYFSKDKNAKIAFRKRILHPGSSIGYHLQKDDEIYYIMSGRGILRMNDKDIPVSTGDAILTKPGSSHGLKPIGNEDLTVMIVYDLK